MFDWMMYRRYDELNPSIEQKRRDRSIIRMIEGYDPSMNETEEKETKMTIDWTQPIETMLGEKVKYIGKSNKGFMVVENASDGSLYKVSEKGLAIITGAVSSNAEFPRWDVRNVPEKPKIETRWQNIYSMFGLDSKEEAEIMSVGTHRTGLIEITFKDGKPVDVKLHSVGDE